MSRFLAPVHTWLFNKIIVLENIEKGIVEAVDSEELKAAHAELLNTFGEYIPMKPLEEMIDQSNIHGWLQERITVAESRQAAFISKFDNDEALLNVVASVYENVGKEAGKNFGTLEDPKMIFNGLNNVLLEGMPCDRVNKVVSEDENMMEWHTLSCVHKNNWESNGVAVENYYRFREAFTKGFVESVGPAFEYAYTNTDGQVHVLNRK